MSMKKIFWQESQEWSTQSNYDYEKFEKRLIKHFKKGGSLTQTAVAGVCEVSTSTMNRWLNRNNEDDFKPLLYDLIDKYRCIAAKKIDDYHLEAAIGELQNANARLLQDRYDALVKDKEDFQNNTITVKYENEEDIEFELKQVKKQLDDLEAQ